MPLMAANLPPRPPVPPLPLSRYLGNQIHPSMKDAWRCQATKMRGNPRLRLVGTCEPTGSSFLGRSRARLPPSDFPLGAWHLTPSQRIRGESP